MEIDKPRRGRPTNAELKARFGEEQNLSERLRTGLTAPPMSEDHHAHISSLLICRCKSCRESFFLEYPSTVTPVAALMSANNRFKGCGGQEGHPVWETVFFSDLDMRRRKLA